MVRPSNTWPLCFVFVPILISFLFGHAYLMMAKGLGVVILSLYVSTQFERACHLHKGADVLVQHAQGWL